MPEWQNYRATLFFFSFFLASCALSQLDRRFMHSGPPDVPSRRAGSKCVWGKNNLISWSTHLLHVGFFFSLSVILNVTVSWPLSCGLINSEMLSRSEAVICVSFRPFDLSPFSQTCTQAHVISPSCTPPPPTLWEAEITFSSSAAVNCAFVCFAILSHLFQPG